MPTMRFRFPGGRYHATPWGHHVNEGLVEWPPSPWRLVRALVATGYATQGWTEVPLAARRMLDALASRLPWYRLPAATVAHSRHYMPIGTLEKGQQKTTLVFDTWANVGDGELLVWWDVALDADAASLFGELTRSLGYLGRSESWVEADVVEDQKWNDGKADAVPLGDTPRLGSDWEQVTVIAPQPASAYIAWREQAVDAAETALGLPSGKRSRTQNKKREAARAAFPNDLVDAIQRDTSWWKTHRWSQPPGSRRVVYWRRQGALAVTVPVARVVTGASSVETMLLALTTPSGRTSALPSVTRTLPQAEIIHRALVARVAKGARVTCPELTGRDAQQRPLEGHRHAHILPLDLDRDGRLDHVLIYAPMGLGHDAQRAIRELRRTWTKGGVGELQLAVAGSGGLEDLRALSAPFGDTMATVLAPKDGARVWMSETVFVPPRHLKRSGRNTIEGQVNAELAVRGFPAARVEVLPWTGEHLSLRHAVRVRPNRPPPSDVGFLLRLWLDRPCCGPMTLGYGAHFGLGRFTAVHGMFAQ